MWLGVKHVPISCALILLSLSRLSGWLEESSAPAAPPTQASTADASSPPPSSFSLTEPAPPSSKTASATPTDNVAGSILSSMTKRAEANEKPEVDESDLPKMILFMRVMNMAAAALLITCSVSWFISWSGDAKLVHRRIHPNDESHSLTLLLTIRHVHRRFSFLQIIELVSIPAISVWVTAIYASFGGILICCLETQLKFVRTSIAMNFGFLFNSIYRAIFYCLMASVTWSYKGLLGYITAITLGVVALFNTYILCRYPTYRKMRETIAAEEDKRIEAKINQQIRKQAISSFTG